jgi:SOS regulatory protein LexA
MDLPLITNRLKLFYKQNHRLPTYGEMVTVLKYNSKGSTYYVVKKLIEKGIIAKDDNGKLIPKTLLDIPMLGTIKAGYPIPAEVIEDRYFNFHHLFSNLSTEAFALTVSGDSMLEEGILDGDIVIIDKTIRPQVGDVVAACIDGEWTVKYYRKEGDNVSFHPANEKYPILIPKVSLTIGGLVVHVIRSYR